MITSHVVAQQRRLTDDGVMTDVTIERSKLVDTTPERAWDVIADLDGYHRHVRGLRNTDVVSGTGQGAVRHCTDSAGSDWFETCDVWVPGSHYSVDVDVSTYPLKYRALFSAFRGTWSVTPEDGETRIGMRFDATLRRVPGISMLVDRLIEQSSADLDATLDSYETAIIGSVSSPE